jgi:hypothetical protein
VRRQAFLRALATTAAGLAVGDPLAEVLGRAVNGATPARVGATDVQQVNHAIAMFGDWQDLNGGGACKDAIAGQVQWATGLLKARASDAVMNDLYRSVGFLADVAGWGAFDAGQHDAARQYFEVALSCAEQANDWGLRANALSDMARQAIYVGRPDDGLSLIELAQVRQDRQTPTVRAMPETVRARSLAKVGRPEDSYGAVLAAEEHFSHQNPADDPPWIAYFNAPDLASDAGHALLDGALDGRHTDDARSRLQQSIDSYPPAQARGRAFSTAKLAILELRVGDPHVGVALAEQALNAASQLSSQRAHDDLVEMRSALKLRNDVPGTTDLRTRLTQTIGTI